MNWWTDQTPLGFEVAILNAHQKLVEGEALGFDIDPLRTAAGRH
jgi:hypothetical protein